MPQSPHPTREAAESPSLDHLPFESLPLPIGNGGGIDLISRVDQIRSGGFSRLTNAIASPGSGIDTRPGLTLAITHDVSQDIHSLLRVNNPIADPALNYYLTGMGTILRWNQTGIAATTVQTGFSGSPLTFAVAADEFSHTPFVYIGDRSQMKKVKVTTGVSSPIGLPAPAVPASVTQSTPLKTVIASFDTTDRTEAGNWRRGHVGVGPGVPVLTDITGPAPALTGAVLMQTDPGTATESYLSYAFCRFSLADGSWAPRDLSVIGPAGVDQRDATDDDVVHIWLKFNRPDHIQEVRLYFQCSPLGTVSDPVTHDHEIVPDKLPPPGMPPPEDDPILIAAGITGGAAYMRAFRPSDYTNFIAGTDTAQGAADTIRTSSLLTGYTEPAQPAATRDPSDVVHPPGESSVPSASWAQLGAPAGSTAWTEYGKIGVPLRRGDFLKIGAAGETGTDWSTIYAMWVVIITTDAFAVDCALGECYLTGGYDPDTSEPDATPYDYRLVNYDTATGARSNPSPVMTDTTDVIRQKVTITPAAAYGLASVRQEAYRRGGANGGDWFFVSANSVDGGAIVDTASDTLAAASPALLTDNDQPVTTVAADGSAIYGQPVQSIFGPIEGYLFACRDPNRMGTLYWSKRDEPDHWPAANHIETCPATDELMNGTVYGAQGFVFSRERLYSIQVDLTGGNVVTLPTDCDKGIVSYTAFCVGVGGIFGVSRHDVFVTTGGAPKVISKIIEPLFNNETVNGYLPIDFTYLTAIQLRLYGDDLWFGFQDTAGSRVWWIYSLAYETWRFAQFGKPVFTVYPEPGDNTERQLIVGGTGKVYEHRGVTDDGTGITAVSRTNADVFGKPREEKLLGDVAVRAQMAGGTLTTTARLNADTVANVGVSVVGASTLSRYVLDLFGTTPQHADSLSLEFSWTTTDGMSELPYIDRVSIDTAIQPEVTMNRATTWHPLNNVGEAFCIGMYIDCDTGGVDRTILVEGLLNGSPVALATLTVNSNHGRRQWFSWPAQHVDMVRLRPTGDCVWWMLFGQGWICDAEPPRISKWNSNFEDASDQYCTGVDLTADTFGTTKTIEVRVDGTLIKTTTITSSGKRVHHITIPWTRGHIFNFRSTDDNIGLLYNHHWYLDPEPTELTNLDQNYTVAGTLADKWLKYVLVEIDTFGQFKSLQIEVDHVVVHTEVVTTSNRQVVQFAFPEVRGRVFRLYPTDDVPARLYSLQWGFDEEPLAITRFETQEQPDSGIRDFYIAIDGQIAIRSASDVTLTVTSYGQNGAALGTHVYTLPSTAGAKAMISGHTFLTPQKGLIWKYVLTSASGFWLYTEESWITYQPLSGGRTVRSAAFGNDDLDAAREMRNAVLTARRPGGAQSPAA